MNEKTSLSPFQQPIFLPQPPPPPHGGGFSLNSKVSPSILLIIIILAIIFFISGLLHLLVRYLLRPSTRDPDDLDNVTALQGQLQQLFHLHDAGVDQFFIDTLPIFNYNAIIGPKNQNHFDCAVCLCEFEPEDKLRLLPKCSHAFHMECIDTWLLSHSTCPLCRASLLADYSMASPIVLVLESGGESSREIHPDREGVLGNSYFGNYCDDDLHKSCEIQEKEEGNQEKVVKVKLGKFKNVDSAGEGSSSSSSNGIDSRRCFSMGSFAYIMDENTSLHVPIRLKKQASKKPGLPLTPGHRVALSECGCDSRREFNGFEAFQFSEIQSGGINNTSTASDGNEINKVVKDGKKESFSVSKIWLRGKKDNRPNSAMDEASRRAVSFRFPVHLNVPAVEGMKTKSGAGGSGSADARRSVSEIGIDGWAHGECDVENESSNIVDSQANAPSFGRRTLIWLMGRQNKVVHSTFSSNV